MQLNSVVGFELEMHGFSSTPTFKVDGLIAFEFTLRFARYQAN
jgi:hypothetical protein